MTTAKAKFTASKYSSIEFEFVGEIKAFQNDQIAQFWRKHYDVGETLEKLYSFQIVAVGCDGICTTFIPNKSLKFSVDEEGFSAVQDGKKLKLSCTSSMTNMFINPRSN